MSDRPGWDYNREFPAHILHENMTIVISSYQANVVLAFGVDEDRNIQPSIVGAERAMGMGRYKDLFYLTNYGQIIVFKSDGPGKSRQHGHFTDRYFSQHAFCGGDVDIHDIRPTSKGVFFVSTKYNCVAKPSLTNTMDVYWYPPWITPQDGKLKAEDRCHLNGLCCVDDVPRYVTCASMGDTLGHWRTHTSEGIVYDIVENRVVCQDVWSPHSPQWYDGKLWILESGTGNFGYVDFETKKFVPKVFIPGFLRGLYFHGNYAYIGSSLDRHDRSFKDLPLSDILICKKQKAVCGIRVVDMKTLSIVHELTIHPLIGINEIYDVVCLPGHRTQIVGISEQESRNRTIKLEVDGVRQSDIDNLVRTDDPLNYIASDSSNSSKNNTTKITDTLVKISQHVTKSKTTVDDEDPYFASEPEKLKLDLPELVDF